MSENMRRRIERGLIKFMKCLALLGNCEELRSSALSKCKKVVSPEWRGLPQT